MMAFNIPEPIFSRIKTAAMYLLKIAILAVAYHLAARLGLEMAFLQMNTSPVWPPTGIALAALLIFGYKLWPGIFLGVLFGFLIDGGQLNIALGIAFGNTLEALAVVYSLKRFIGFHNPIDRIRDVVGLAVFPVFGTAIGATIGTMVLMLAGSVASYGFGAIWLTWWIGDLLGALVIAPLLLVWITTAPSRYKKSTYVEGAVLLVSIILVTYYVFSGLPPVGVFHHALIYTIFPFTIWAALRFGQHGATIAILLVSGIAIWGTVQGVGPFSLGSRNESLILLQTFLAVVSLTSLILAAATIERNKANKQLHALSQRLMKAQEEERLYLSRELHDGSGQVLAALMMQLGLLERDAEKPEAVHTRIVELKHVANAIQDDLHRLAVNLRPASLDHLGLITALQQFLGEFSRRYSIQAEFETVGLPEKRLPIEVETTLFRIVQESLTNVVLHAHATRVDVLLSMQNGRVIAVVEDNGVGFIPISYTMENHLGLFGMRERVKMLGGEFAIESSPGKGTTVRVEVPCND